jgi:acetylornithine deacetylase
MIGFRTVSVDVPSASPVEVSEERGLQEWMAERLAVLGARIDQWEPDAREFRNHPLMPAGHHWRGRPLTAATVSGRGGGRSLIINGHIDVVSPGEYALWASDPFRAVVRDGRVYGRGACDMKGGLAAALFALEALRANDVRLLGDVIFEVVADEETCGMGTIATLARGYRADAALDPEPTSLDVWVATPGTMSGRFVVRGRAGHVDAEQPDWSEGGAVNAIERAVPLVDAVRDLNSSWHDTSRRRHKTIGFPRVQPTIIAGGDFAFNIPESCVVTLAVSYPPSEAGADGFGDPIRFEIMDAVRSAAANDEWLASQPVEWSWNLDFPPSELAADAAIAETCASVAREIGAVGRCVASNSAHDGALLTLAGVPCPAFGPGDIGIAHTVNESIGVEDLLAAARAYARAICRWCGVNLDE